MKKRRNNGRSKKNRGMVVSQKCSNCFRLVPKDKAIVRHKIQNLIEAAALDDVKLATVFNEFDIPKLRYKLKYCISCAVHLRIVRVRSVWMRKVRTPPSNKIVA
ncbi:40S ribosomal protein S26-B [Cucumispora dikerogammari]|nr:40S ribosomal protein S26-B [Cucumispora dikerogammari]